MMVVMIETYTKGTRIKSVYYMETDFCYCSSVSLQILFTIIVLMKFVVIFVYVEKWV